MSHYKSNIRDIEFNLFEVLGRDEVLGAGPFESIDAETARSILTEVDRLSREDLAASYEDSDRNPPVFDPETHTAPLPESFKKSYQAWHDAEYWRLQLPEELGGTPAPSSLIWALGELVLGANAPIWMYGAGPAFASIVHKNGNDRDKRIARAHHRKGLEHHHGARPSPTPAPTWVPAGPRPRSTTTAPGTSPASSGSSPPPRATCATTSSTSSSPVLRASRASVVRAPRA